MKGYKKLPLIYMRGGTSKGAYLDIKDLPSTQENRDACILSLYGSPDKRQINGIGGADPLTSKVALVGKSKRSGIDVDYTFGYVGIDEAVVDYEGNCGNMSSGVGVFALLRGMVKPVEPITVVNIYNTNTKKVIEAHIPVKKGEPVVDGDFKIDGVPGTGAPIMLYFKSPSGSKTGKLLPTGNVKDTMTLIDGRQFTVSLVDAATPAVFVKATDLNCKGTELPAQIENDSNGLMDTLEEIRRMAAVMMGLAMSPETASSAVPKVCLVGEPMTYKTISGQTIENTSIDLVARTKALKVIHKAYAVTGGICTATAALLPGTVVHEIVSERAKKSGIVTLGHPSGTFEFAIDLTCNQQEITLRKAGVARTARPIMEGFAYVADKG